MFINRLAVFHLLIPALRSVGLLKPAPLNVNILNVAIPTEIML